MANIKSQIKRNRQNAALRLRNKSVGSSLKTSVKKVEAAVAAGKAGDDLLRQAQAKIDTAVSKGVLHKRTAARKKSRLAKRVSAEG
jgi:small subunit ribosomal protein S20